MATDDVPGEQPAVDEVVRRARDEAVSSVPNRHGLGDKRFHNDAALLEGADAVAIAVARAIRHGP